MIVGGEDDAGSSAGCLVQGLENEFGCVLVHFGGRLIGEHDCRLRGERPGYCDSLLLSE